MPTKLELKSAREYLLIHRIKIDNFDCDVPSSTLQINWGPTPRGQGRRCGHMIKGSMSGAPRGIKTYYGIDVSKYKKDIGDMMKCLEMYQKARYYIAREYGAKHIPSMLYALKY